MDDSVLMKQSAEVSTDAYINGYDSENHVNGNLVLGIVIGICVILGISLGIFIGKKSANK